MATQLMIAGREILDAEEVIESYLANHPKTLRVYDALANDGGPLTVEMTAATYVISSRMSHEGGAKLVEVVKSVDWSEVPGGARLEDADPTIVGGLYDAADRVYKAIYALRPDRVGNGKIHKTLHLIRPALVPIVDSQLRKLYKAQARAAASRIKDARPDFEYKSTHWAAIREDLLQNEAALTALGQKFQPETSALTGRVEPLTNVRLLDIVAWRGFTHPDS